MGTSQMHDLMRLRPYERGLGQCGGIRGVKAESMPVRPEVTACGIRLQLQTQGDGAEKRMIQYECCPSADHGKMGLPFEWCHNVTSRRERWPEPSRQRQMYGRYARHDRRRHA